MLLYWYHFHESGVRIKVETDDDTTAGHFCIYCTAEEADELQRRTVDVSLTLYAEHEFKRLDVYGASRRRHAHRFLLGSLGRDRYAKGTVARRRQRSSNGAHRAVRHAGRG